MTHWNEAQDRLDRVVVPADASLLEAVEAMDAGGVGALLICDERRRLLGLFTDGDFRRAILHDRQMEAPCLEVATREPVVAPPEVSAERALEMMNHSRPFAINHLPLVDEEGVAHGLLLRGDLLPEDDLGLHAVIMAGGFGRRLHPLTEKLPKPMLPVGDRPLLQRIIEQLRDSGIDQICLTTHYRPETIEDHFGDGRAFGVDIRYANEDEPLGTAGALGRFRQAEQPLLVMNGDILTDVDFRAMAAFHREHGAAVTVGVRRYGLKVPYGIVESDGVAVTAIREKPAITHPIVAGIYLIEPAALALLPADREHLDMPDFIRRLLAAGLEVISFPVTEYWLDIGQPEDYERAQDDAREGRLRGLRPTSRRGG